MITGVPIVQILLCFVTIIYFEPCCLTCGFHKNSDVSFSIRNTPPGQTKSVRKGFFCSKLYLSLISLDAPCYTKLLANHSSKVASSATFCC